MMGNSLPEWLQPKRTKHDKHRIAGQITALRAGPEGMAARGRLGGRACNDLKTPEQRRIELARVRSFWAIATWSANGVRVRSTPPINYNAYLMLKGWAAHGPTHARALARIVGVSCGSRDRVLRELHRCGYIEGDARNHGQPRRRWITPSGRAVLEQVRALIEGPQ